MTRTRWAAGEIRDYDLAVIVDLTFAGQLLRMATRPIDFDTGESYIGTLQPVTVKRELHLFDQAPGRQPLGIEGYVPIDVATWSARGHRLEGSAVEVSQVRVDRYGAPVDAWEHRRLLVRGAALDSMWGPHGNGHSFVRFDACRPWYWPRGKIPTVDQAVRRSTSRVAGWVSDADLGIAYPLVFGHPGRDPAHQDGWIPAFRAPWLRKWKNYHLMIAGMGELDADTARISTQDDPVGAEVTLRQEYSADGSTTPARDSRGQLLTVVDLDLEGVEEDDGADFIGDSYVPAVDEQGDVWIAFPDGGGLTADGRVIRDAGDVITYLLDVAGVAYDAGQFAAVKPLISWLKIDFAICEPVDAMEFLQAEILPLLPVSVLPTGDGVQLWAWRPDASAADAIAHLDADSDPEVTVADLLEEDGEQVTNTLTIRYGWNGLAGAYRYSMSIGPEYVASTDVAQGEIRSSATAYTYERVGLIASGLSGADGNGIRVTVTMSATPASEAATYDPANRVLSITVETGTSTSTSLSSTINAGAFPGVAFPRGAGSDRWYDTTTPSITLGIVDYGTAPSELCRRSRDLMAAGDPAGPAAGIRATEIETALVYDASSAARILDWKAAAYALPMRRLSMTGPERRYGHLEPGDVVTVTSSEFALSSSVGWVEAAESYGDGVVGVRVVFVGA